MGGEGLQPQQQQGARIAAHRGNQPARGGNRLPLRLPQPKRLMVDEPALQNLRVLELHFTGEPSLVLGC